MPTAEPALSAPARALLAQSGEALARRDYGGAEALLQRALRIEPRHPALWLALAELALESGRTAPAGQYARKALSLTSTATPTAVRARAVIAAAGG